MLKRSPLGTALKRWVSCGKGNIVAVRTNARYPLILLKQNGARHTCTHS